jgi:hypothetical protein
MSRIREGQDILQAVSQRLDEISAAVGPNGDPEELGMLATAEQLEADAEQKMAAASAAPSAQEAAELARQAEELFRQAEGLRQQCQEILEQRYAVAGATADAAKDVQGQLSEAVEGTNHGTDLITTAAGITAANEEARDSLAAAMSMATEREQTHACLGLIVQAQEQGATAQGLCGQLQSQIEQYVGRL